MKKLNDLLVETTKLRAAIKEIQSKEKELKAQVLSKPKSQKDSS